MGRADKTVRGAQAVKEVEHQGGTYRLLGGSSKGHKTFQKAKETAREFERMHEGRDAIVVRYPDGIENRTPIGGFSEGVHKETVEYLVYVERQDFLGDIL